MRALTLGTLLLLAIPLQACDRQAETAAVADTAEARLAAARQLARAAQSPDVVIDSAMVAFENGFRAQNDTLPPAARFRGSVDMLMNRVKPVLQEEFGGRLPELWERMARVYAAELTLAEIQRARDFFGTPTGRKFLRLGNMLAAEAQMSGQQVTAAEQAEATRLAGDRAQAALSEAERAELDAFARRDFAALQRVGPKINAEVLSFINQPPSPAMEQKLNAIFAELNEAR